MEEWGCCRESNERPASNSVNLARAARELVRGQDVAAIAVFTFAGREALDLSKVRPGVPILAFTPEPETYFRLALLWGVIPQLIPYTDTVEAMLAHIEAARIRNSPMHAGQQVVLVAGLSGRQVVPANLILVHTVRTPLAAIQEVNAAADALVPYMAL